MIIESSNFNLKHIAESGQCFRMNQIDTKRYSVVAYDHYVELFQVSKDKVEISCSKEEYDTIWKDYFDLDYDYNRIVTSLVAGDDEFLKNAAKFGDGLRILKQEPFEALISFIISQNKNIPAIKSSIEKLCMLYGTCKTTIDGKVYYTFPTPKQLANSALKDLRATGLGYRDQYILKTSQSVHQGEINLLNLRYSKNEDAMEQLLKLHGVGVKVANCVSLYGLHHIEVFPIDVWIARILKEIYNNQFDLKQYQGYAGIVQQYMFYYMRNGKQSEKK